MRAVGCGLLALGKGVELLRVDQTGGGVAGPVRTSSNGAGWLRGKGVTWPLGHLATDLVLSTFLLKACLLSARVVILNGSIQLLCKALQVGRFTCLFVHIK